MASVITRLRHERGMTQAQLAVVVGVDRRTIRRWESGQSKPRNSHLIRLALALDVEPEALG